jgi:superfamily II DNA or RNA helicase
MAGRGDNGAVIEQFRNGELDVLINIQILTEGVDVPDIQTLARMGPFPGYDARAF